MSDISLSPIPGGGAATATSAVNKLLSISAFAGTLNALFLDNKSIAGPVIYPWSSLAGEAGAAGTLTGGGFGIVNDAALTSITFNALTSLAGSIKLYENPLLTNIALPLLASVSGKLSLYENDTLATIALPSLTTLSGLVEIYEHAALTTLDLSALATCSNRLDIYNNTALASIDLSALVTPGTINIYGNSALTSLDLSGVVAGGAGISVYGNTALTSVDVSGMTSLDAFYLDGSMTSVSFPALVTKTSAALLAIYVATPNLASISFPSFTTLSNGGFDLYQNPALTSISIPLLASIGGTAHIDASANPLLTSFTVSASIALNDGFLIDIHNGALDTASVDGILAACAAGIGGTISGTINLAGGTNSSPTGGATNANYLILTGAGITVNIN